MRTSKTSAHPAWRKPFLGISSFVGQDKLHMAYNASKGAVRIMTKSGAVQYARDAGH